MSNRLADDLLQKLRMAFSSYIAVHPSGSRAFFFSNTAKQIVDEWCKANLK